jgi:hypothetical protein
LRVLAGRRDADLAHLTEERYRKEDVGELSLAEASRLIDELGGAKTQEGRRPVGLVVLGPADRRGVVTVGGRLRGRETDRR